MSSQKKEVATATQNGTNGVSKIDAKLSSLTVSENGKVQSLEPDAKHTRKEPTLQDKLKKFDELQKLLSRREKLQEALDNITDFHISQTGGCNLKFLDSNGLTFGISHPIIIGEIVNSIKQKLNKELEEVERLFDFTI